MKEHIKIIITITLKNLIVLQINEVIFLHESERCTYYLLRYLICFFIQLASYDGREFVGYYKREVTHPPFCCHRRQRNSKSDVKEADVGKEFYGKSDFDNKETCVPENR